MKTCPPTAKHKAIYDDFVGLLKKHGDSVPAVEMLAIAANIVGRLVALQDQRRITPEKAMEIVARNMGQGNHEQIQTLAEPMGNG